MMKIPASDQVTAFFGDQFPSWSYQGNCQGSQHNKDILNTQEIPRNFKVLCQELGTKIHTHTHTHTHTQRRERS
jgi:hypothetical protein